MKTILRRIFHTPDDVDLNSHLQDWFWKNVMRMNHGVSWPVHFTSRVTAHEKIVAGPGSWPGDMPGCYIQGINGIFIGAGCQFGPGVGIISANHNPADLAQHLPAPPIQIGSNCWFGMHAIILPGVQLGDRTIVGAGSVVTDSFPGGNCIIAGNPARLVRAL